MDESERYGLHSIYSFEVEPQAFSLMEKVVSQLQAIETAVEQTSAAIRQSGIAQNLNRIGRNAQGSVDKVADQIRTVGSRSQESSNHLRSLAQELRALRAESKTIDLDVADPDSFQRAKASLNDYIAQLDRQTRHRKLHSTCGNMVNFFHNAVPQHIRSSRSQCTRQHRQNHTQPSDKTFR